MIRVGTNKYKQIGKHGYEGVTITFEHRVDKTTYTKHTPGSPRTEALRAALAPMDPSEWRVICISTPQTIYDDLILRRKLQTPGEKFNGRGGRDASRSSGGVRPPEYSLLGQIGAVDFL